MVITSPKDFYQRKVLVMGLGLHGGGVAAAYWLFRQGAEVIVTDTKKREELTASVTRLTSLCNEYRLAHPSARLFSIEYVLGRHREEDVARVDCIIQNPGVPRESPFLESARARGIPIHNDASLLFLLTPRTSKIGVTGTRGKTTTVTLIGEMLKKKYPKAISAGMATPTGAVSFFSIIDRVCENERNGIASPLVLELSSWQLEILGSYRMSPHCAVITNIFPDHLNRYASMDEYVAAKKMLYAYADTVVFNYDNEITRALGEEYGNASKRYWFSQKSTTIDQGASLHKSDRSLYVRKNNHADCICSVKELRVKGVHNQYNALAALVVGLINGISPEDMADVLRSFSGVSGRLEYIGTHDGRMIYNDTTATSPDATIAALQTLGTCSRKIILIAGGADKKLDFSDIGAAITAYVKSLILLSGTASPMIATSALSFGYAGGVMHANSMEEGVRKAWSASTKGDIILLSPGATSFAQFAHEFDRGDQFIEAVNNIVISNR